METPTSSREFLISLIQRLSYANAHVNTISAQLSGGTSASSITILTITCTNFSEARISGSASLTCFQSPLYNQRTLVYLVSMRFNLSLIIVYLYSLDPPWLRLSFEMTKGLQYDRKLGVTMPVLTSAAHIMTAIPAQPAVCFLSPVQPPSSCTTWSSEDYSEPRRCCPVKVVAMPMSLPPGPAYLLNLAPYFALPSVAVYCLFASAHKFLDINTPRWLVFILTLFARPGLFFLRCRYEKWRNERAAAALGAVLPPHVTDSPFSVVSRVLARLQDSFPGLWYIMWGYSGSW